MFWGGFSAAKLKANAKMASHRITLYLNKRTNATKMQKKEIAELLRNGKEEKARIRVESVIREDFTMEAYEILQLMCDLLAERIRLIASERDTPGDMREALSTLVYAARRTEIPELLEVRKQLGLKYGKPFLERASTNAGGVVNARIVERLSVRPPDPVLVLNYLREIAREYRVDWEPENPDFVSGPAGGGGGGDGSGGAGGLPMGYSVAPSAGAGFGQLYQPPAAGAAHAGLPPASMAGLAGPAPVVPAFPPPPPSSSGATAGPPSMPDFPAIPSMPPHPAAAPAPGMPGMPGMGGPGGLPDFPAPPSGVPGPPAVPGMPPAYGAAGPPPAAPTAGAGADETSGGAGGGGGGGGGDLPDFDDLQRRLQALQGGGGAAGGPPGAV